MRLGNFRQEAPPFHYVYDFGDDWHHQIEIETLLVADSDQTYPACIDGARSRPPEGVGGTGGYEDFLEVFADPNHPDHRQMRRWAGRSFDPEGFDLTKTDLAVRQALAKPRRVRATTLS
ncbi:plasmid pRiA4b ORF-3 family protein [Xanthobacter autotrophicus NCIMB 11399]